MLGLYNRSPLSKEEVEDLIRREFLAMLFKKKRNLKNEDDADADPEEVTSGIIESLLSIRSTLINPKIECLVPDKVDELWSDEYKAQFKAKTGKEVDLETGNTWYPDWMTHQYMTTGFLGHLVSLKVEYDIAVDKAMVEFFQQEAKKQLPS